MPPFLLRVRMDEVTKRWIRNRSDELAVANGCRFDEARGKHVVAWVQKYCRLYEGSRGPMILKDWQYEATMRLFGWVKWSKRLNRWVRRFTRALVLIAKKNGKSPTAAAWALYLLAGDGEPGQHVFFAAADGSQARIMAKHAVEMVRASPALDETQGGEIGINLAEMKLMHRPSLSDAKPISSGDNRAAKAKQGLNGSVVIDEIHVVTREFISESAIDKAGASRDEPLHIEVSTAGKDPDGYGYQQYEYGKQVEAGEVDDQGFLFLCYEAPQDLTDEALHADPVKYGRMANPTWGRIIQEEEFLADYNRSRRSLVDLADFKTFRLNIWQKSSAPWIRAEDWRQCEVEFDESELYGRDCFAGLDLGITRDMSALVFVFPWDDDCFRVLPFAYMPEKALENMALKVPQLFQWQRSGFLIATPGDTTDYRYLLDTFEEKAEKFRVIELIYDERFAEQITQEMSERTGVPRLKFAQGPGKFNEPTQNFERAVLQRKIQHNGNPLLSWQIGHTNVITDRRGNMMPVKPPRSDHKKIDAVMASIMAFAGARLQENDANWYGAGKRTLRD